MHRRIAICVALASIGAMLGISCLQADSTETRWPDAGPDAEILEGITFSTSTDPTVVIFSLSNTNEHSSDISEAFIYSDGRVELIKSTRSGPYYRLTKTQTESHQLELSLNEVETIMRTAVEHGLAETSTDQLKARKRSHGQRGITTGGSHVRIQIALEEYKTESGLFNDLHHQIATTDPKFASSRYPEVRELTGFHKLNQIVAGLWHTARKETK